MPLDPQQHRELTRWATEAFANGFAAAIEGMAGTRPGLSFEMAASPPELAAPVFRWEQPFAGIAGEAFAAAADLDVLAVGQHVMLAAGIEDASPEELRSTFRESLNQAFSILTQAMTARLQSEVTSSGGAEVQITPPDLLWGAVRLTLGEKSAAVFLGLPPQLLESLEIAPKALAQAAGAGSSDSTQQTAAVRAAQGSKTFELLLDVELPVSVSFGHALVPLKDVLKLTTGSIVELSRAVVEPVDIVVNNCVIAKGEVVVVEGNFGVRIQQVISRSERIRSLQ